MGRRSRTSTEEDGLGSRKLVEDEGGIIARSIGNLTTGTGETTVKGEQAVDAHRGGSGVIDACGGKARENKAGGVIGVGKTQVAPADAAGRAVIGENGDIHQLRRGRQPCANRGHARVGVQAAPSGGTRRARHAHAEHTAAVFHDPGENARTGRDVTNGECCRTGRGPDRACTIQSPNRHARIHAVQIKNCALTEIKRDTRSTQSTAAAELNGSLIDCGRAGLGIDRIDDKLAQAVLGKATRHLGLKISVQCQGVPRPVRSDDYGARANT